MRKNGQYIISEISSALSLLAFVLHKLGRYHRDAQFYLANCTFSKNMADSDIYFVRGNQIQWGRRVYFYNCHHTGDDYAWQPLEPDPYSLMTKNFNPI